MLNDSTLMHNYFARLGLEPEVADLYLALHIYGPQSLLQLARNARIERTRVYRLLDSLSDARLIKVETHAKRKIYRAAPITNLRVLLSRCYGIRQELTVKTFLSYMRIFKTVRIQPSLTVG
jgi:sugar-specific transcriptional regulator TrmB